MVTSSVVRLSLVSALFAGCLILAGCGTPDTVTEQETPANVKGGAGVTKGTGEQGGGATADMMAAPPGVKTGTP